MSSHLDEDSRLNSYYHQYFKYENVCNNINELDSQEILDCESRPIMTCILIMSIIVLILLRFLSPYIKEWFSSRNDSKQQRNVQDEEVGLLETTPV